MLLVGQGERDRERFFVRNIKPEWTFDFRRNSLSGFSRLCDGNLRLLRYGHVAGFVSVPRPATGSQARLSRGGRESNYANQQKHDASRKNGPIEGADPLHAFAIESKRSRCNTQLAILPPQLAARQVTLTYNRIDYRHLKRRLAFLDTSIESAYVLEAWRAKQVA